MQTTRREWLATAGGLAFAGRLKAVEGLFHATSLNHISLTVPDVKSAADFYSRVLGTRIIQDMGSRGQMRGLKRKLSRAVPGRRSRPEPLLARR